MRKSAKIAIVLLGVFALHSGFSKEAPASKESLRQVYPAFTEIAEKGMPATVSIKAQIVSKGLSGKKNFSGDPFDFFGEDFFRGFFGHSFPQPQQQQPQYAGGSGFLISSDGYIVTNHHVVKDADPDQITVTLNDGSEYLAAVKGSDERTDLAVLKIDEKDLPYLTFGDSESLKVGEWAVAIGNPIGLEGTLTEGVISAKGRQDLGILSYEDFIQTTAPINFGNSGGPLFNIDGEVIGVTTAKSVHYTGIGFAIPSKIAEHIVYQIIDSGAVKQGYLGVILQPIDKDLAEALGLEKQEGVLISDITKGSPAEEAGLKVGDVILQANGKPARNMQALRNEILFTNPGDELSLRILRDSKEISCTATLGAQDESRLVAQEVLQKLGVEVSNLTPELGLRLGQSADTGVVITRVDPGSRAALQGLRSGAVITAVATEGGQQKKVNNLADLEEALQEFGDKKLLVLIVRQQNFHRYHTFRLR